MKEEAENEERRLPLLPRCGGDLPIHVLRLKTGRRRKGEGAEEEWKDEEEEGCSVAVAFSTMSLTVYN